MNQKYIQEIVACCNLEDNMKVSNKKRVTRIKYINTNNGKFPFIHIAEGIAESTFLNRWEQYLKYFLEPELELKNSVETKEEKMQFGSKERFYRICKEHGIDV